MIVGFWSFSIVFEYYFRRETIFPHLGKPSSRNFPVGTRSKTSSLTSITAVDSQQRLVVKPKFIQSISACKNHSISLLSSSNHL